MAEYYFISQLPSLDGIAENVPLPITEERFLELGNRFLSNKAKKELEKLSLTPPPIPEQSSSALVNARNANERDLRFALAKVRAEKMKKSFDAGEHVSSNELMQVARTAAEMDNPMEAEQFLSAYRFRFLETLRPMDPFSEDFVYYYWFRLKLLLRLRQFDTKRGQEAYRTIYNSVLSGESLEAIQ